jgi:hypothetical protein
LYFIAIEIKDNSYNQINDVKRFNIVVRNLISFPISDNIAKNVELIEWQDKKWLKNCDINKLIADGKRGKP